MNEWMNEMKNFIHVSKDLAYGNPYANRDT